MAAKKKSKAKPRDNRKAFIRNIAEVPWKEFPGHFGSALSKPLVMPETANAKRIDYRISMYQPMAYVQPHVHKVQEQIYHVIEGEGLMELDGKKQVMRILGVDMRHTPFISEDFDRLSQFCKNEITRHRRQHLLGECG